MKNTVRSAYSTLCILLNVEFRDLWHFVCNEFFFKQKLISNNDIANQSECCHLKQTWDQKLSFKSPIPIAASEIPLMDLI